MRVSAVAFIICAGLLGTGCISSNQSVVKTQIVTVPDGAIVEYNGERLGRAPAQVVLPQDENGRLTERAVVRVIPNTGQPTLFAQQRVFEPGERTERVPNRIMVDMTIAGTNAVASGSAPTAETADIETNSEHKVRTAVPYVNRGKPTQAVGLDRWKPGIY